MEIVPAGGVGSFYSERDELINTPNKEMLPAILSAAKANQRRADHFLRAGAIYGDAALIIKGHLHDVVFRTLCGVLALYDFNSDELGELVAGTQEYLAESSSIDQFNETIKTIIKFASLPSDTD